MNSPTHQCWGALPSKFSYLPCLSPCTHYGAGRLGPRCGLGLLHGPRTGCGSAPVRVAELRSRLLTGCGRDLRGLVACLRHYARALGIHAVQQREHGAQLSFQLTTAIHRHRGARGRSRGPGGPEAVMEITQLGHTGLLTGLAVQMRPKLSADPPAA